MDKQKKRRPTTAQAIGIGIALGTAMGLATGNIALGVSMAIVFGVALSRPSTPKSSGKPDS